MRWLTLAGVLLYLTRCNDAGVLKCHPGSKDMLCALKNTEILSTIQNLTDRDSSSQESGDRTPFDIGLTSDESHENQCLPGSAWESNCHICHCTRSGHAECKEVPFCIAENLADPIPCKPNSTFKRFRETCVCLENGQGLCAIESHDIQKRSPDEETCTPGTSFKKECNTCRCLDDGRAVCTKRGCLGFKDLHKREITEVNTTSRSARALSNGETAKTCQPGQEFRMDCNKCLCDNAGTDFSCTRIDCAALNNGGADRTKRDTTTVEHKCEPGSVFDRACNVCRCTSDGLHAVCQLKRCNKDAEATTETSPAFRCTPGDQFRRDCNDCTCSADGKNVFCTLRLCDDPSMAP